MKKRILYLTTISFITIENFSIDAMASQGRSTRDNLSCTDYCTVGGKEAVKLPAAFGIVTLNGKLNGENLKKWLEKNFPAGTEGSITALINKQKDLRNFFSQDSAVENNKLRH